MSDPPDQPQDLDAAAALTSPDIDVEAFLATLHHNHRATRSIDVGYPVATDIDYGPVEALADGFWNNIGDPGTDPQGGNHAKAAERALLEWATTLFGFSSGNSWGYATTGGTEGNHAALHAARNTFAADRNGRPTAVAYYSTAAHYSIPKILEFLGLPAIPVRSDARGEINYDDLARMVLRHPGRPAIVTATVGTTMTEAIDDVTLIDEVLDD